jgi:hypothetical protein
MYRTLVISGGASKVIGGVRRLESQGQEDTQCAQ